MSRYKKNMAKISITQTFNASPKQIFDAITPHTVFGSFLPLINVSIAKKGIISDNDTGSIRGMGLSIFGLHIHPVQEQVLVYEPGIRHEYKIVGLAKKFIRHHYGIITFDKLNEQQTQVRWEIELSTFSESVSKIILRMLERFVGNGLAKVAQELEDR